MKTLHSYPTLYSKTSTGKINSWNIAVIETDEGIFIETVHGYEDGKMQRDLRAVREGKNIGRANETTVVEQAIAEARSKWTKKLETGCSTSPKLTEQPLLPMLALKFNERKHEVVYPCFTQPKLNGVRCLAKKVNDYEIIFFSRNGKQYNTLSHLIPDLLKCMNVGDVFDGEIYNHEIGFQRIVAAVKREKEKHPDVELLQYWIYDMVSDKDFVDRTETLFNALQKVDNSKHLVYVFPLQANNEGEIHAMHDSYAADAFEGAMVRNRLGSYTIKHRSKNLLKLKNFIDEEFLIVDGRSSEGREEGCVVFKCKTTKGNLFDVRPRGTVEQRKEWLSNIESIKGKMLTVRYQNLSDEGIPIFPVGLAIRDYE